MSALPIYMNRAQGVCKKKYIYIKLFVSKLVENRLVHWIVEAAMVCYSSCGSLAPVGL